jgi:hypothetical protein
VVSILTINCRVFGAVSIDVINFSSTSNPMFGGLYV